MNLFEWNAVSDIQSQVGKEGSAIGCFTELYTNVTVLNFENAQKI